MTAPEGLDLADYKFTKLPLGKICIETVSIFQKCKKNIVFETFKECAGNNDLIRSKSLLLPFDNGYLGPG